MISFSNSPRFAHLEAADLERLEALVKLDQFAPGEVVASAEKPSEWLSILCSGALELRISGTQGEVALATLGPGDLVGELETFARLPAGLRLVARDETLVRACPKNPLVQELRAHRQLAVALLFAYCRSISEKIRQANDVLVGLRARTPNTSLPPPARTQRAPHLSGDEQQWLAMLGRNLEAGAGETVVSEGDGTRSFYVIEAGEARVRRGEHVLADLGPGDMFGFMSFLDGQPRSASVVTGEGPARFTVIEGDALHRALGMNFTVAFKFLATMCGILGRTFVETAVSVRARA